MRGNKLFMMLLAGALAIAFGFGDGASAAKKKLTYDQAYAKCKAELDKARLAGHTERYTVGAGLHEEVRLQALNGWHLGCR